MYLAPEVESLGNSFKVSKLMVGSSQDLHLQARGRTEGIRLPNTVHLTWSMLQELYRGWTNSLMYGHTYLPFKIDIFCIEP